VRQILYRIGGPHEGNDKSLRIAICEVIGKEQFVSDVSVER
jgi:hypothetical protein